MSRYAYDESDHLYRQRIKEILTAPPCHGLPKDPTELLPYIYLGNQGHAEDYRLLQRHNLLEQMEDARLKQARVTTGKRSNSLSRAFHDPDQVYDPGYYVVKTICIPKEASRSQYQEILNHYAPPSYDSLYGSYNYAPTTRYSSRYVPDLDYEVPPRRARSVHPEMLTSKRAPLYASVIGSTKAPHFTVRGGKDYTTPKSYVDYTSSSTRPSRSLYTSTNPRGVRAQSVGPSLSRDSKYIPSSKKSTVSFDDDKFKVNDKPSNMYTSKSKSAFNLDDIENKYRRYKGVPIVPTRSSRGVRNLIEPDSPLMRGAKNYRSASVQRF